MKKYKSITNSMRHVCLIDIKKETSKNTTLPARLLQTHNTKNYSGRNISGKITVFTKCNKHKRLYRIIDNKRTNKNVPGIVYSIEYDPNRSSFISLITYNNNITCYILSVYNVKVGDKLMSYDSPPSEDQLFYRPGDNNRLIYINTGVVIHNVEYLPEHGGIFIRSAGTYGKIIKKYTKINKVLIELPSKVRFFTSIYSFATIGVVSNKFYKNRVIGKAGRNRWLGKKSTVRGVAMNPVDHPHGGGEGKKSNPSWKRSPWGKILRKHNRRRIFL